MLKECRRLFYPHPSNNYKAAVVQPAGLSLLLAIFLLTQSFLRLFLGWSPGILGYASDITPGAILELTNQERTRQGLGALRVDEKLNEAARQKAADMFALNYWSHVSPRGVDPWHFIVNVGYHYLFAGENLARDFAHSGEVVQAWMESPSHRENVLNGKYQEIGVAVVNGTLEGQETTLVVQMFATPQVKPAVIVQEAAATEAAPAQTEPAPAQAEPAAVVEEELAVEAAPAATEVVAAVVLAQPTKEEKSVLLSSFDLAKGVNLAFAGLLFGVLAVDGLIIWRKKAARIAGHNYIHGTFVIILIIMILLSQRGLIL